MSDEANSEPGSEVADGSARLRSKAGVPRVALATIDGYAQKIWNAARRAEVPAVTVARALTGKQDSPASGGAYNDNIAALRLFKVVESVKGGRLKLTELGVALANNADEPRHLVALREALEGVPAYAEIFTTYGDGDFPGVGPIATNFEFNYELSAKAAATAADLFVKGAKYAGLLDESESHLAVATVPVAPDRDDDVASRQGGGDSDEDGSAGPTVDHTAGAGVTATDALLGTPPILDTLREEGQQGGSRSTQDRTTPTALTIHIDMSKWVADDAIAVLKALGFGGAGGSS